jgi:hypothetical protein
VIRAPLSARALFVAAKMAPARPRRVYRSVDAALAGGKASIKLN